MIKDVYSEIQTHLKSGWGTTTAIAFEGTKRDSDLSEYIRATFLPADVTQIGVGLPGLADFSGILAVDVFIKSGNGIGRAAELADLVMPIFKRSTRLTDATGRDVIFRTPSPLPGREDGHGYYHIPVHCPWHTYYAN